MSKHGIEKIAALTNKQREEIFRETAAQNNIPEAVAEKDFWVCWALHRIFSDQTLSKQLLFKGGTSLSKCYGLIERFSEDIDLILDWTLVSDEDPYLERSHTQQDKFNKQMEQDARIYIANHLLPQLQTLFEGFTLTIKEDSPKSIFLAFPQAFSSAYIKPKVELEIGPMSAMTPNNHYIITPYCNKVTQELVGELAISVQAIKAMKTFWDKVTILHCEANRPEEKEQPDRYSRHYYDLFQMLDTPVMTEALQNKNLLQEVLLFKNKFYPQNFADYQQAMKGKIKLLPQEFRRKALKQDYVQMREMIFGAYPDFDEIITRLADFEWELNTSE